MTGFDVVVGLEVHVQLATTTKLFCPCPNRFGAPPNTLVCPVCLGYPGALPNPNRRAVELAAALALALGCRVHPRSTFERKSYSYPDLPKGYQITQHREPLATGGRLPLAGGGALRLGRLHLEEDAGKLVHHPASGSTLVDFNRCGVPLVEIVSEPELGSAAAAREALRELHRLLLYTGVSRASLEEGSLRCDVNVSLRSAGGDGGEPVEVKNLASFREVGRAVDAEAARQRRLLAEGGRVRRETRRFDAAGGTTRALRGKEEAPDYRWLPDPDLPRLAIEPRRLEELRRELPEPPWERRRRLVAGGLAVADAAVLTATRELADYYEAAAAEAPPAAVAAWVRTEVLRRSKRRSSPAEALPPSRLARLVNLVAAGRVSATAAREVLDRLWGSDEEPEELVGRLSPAPVVDTRCVGAWCAEVLAAHPELVERYRRGHHQVLGYLVGRVVERSAGRAEPKRVRRELEERLAGAPVAP
jgi:aspartyl-tRNA(Asn)/glutamyl-tRNA(Gln) amidotransferase subunit B